MCEYKTERKKTLSMNEIEAEALCYRSVAMDLTSCKIKILSRTGTVLKTRIKKI